MISIEDITSTFESDIRSVYSDNRLRFKPSGHYASMVGHECLFYLWAYQKYWELWPKIDDGLQGVFAQGRDGERSVGIDLAKAGWELRGQQNHFVEERLNIRGRMDGYLYHDIIKSYVESLTGRTMLQSWPGIPAEIKTAAGSMMRYFTNFGEMLQSPKKWIRKYPAQVLLYGDLNSEYSPIVALIVRSKQDRTTKLLIEDIREYNDEIWKIYDRVFMVNEFLGNDVEPEPISYSHIWCFDCEAWQWCKHSRMCRGEGVALLPDTTASELLDLHRAMEYTNEARKEYDSSKRAIRSILERLGRIPKEPCEKIVTAGKGIIIEASTSTDKKVSINIKGA